MVRGQIQGFVLGSVEGPGFSDQGSSAAVAAVAAAAVTAGTSMERLKALEDSVQV